jgi:succinate-acetate transporter protein
MADVLGLFAIAFFTFLVAGFGLDLFKTPAAAAAVSIPVGLVTLLAAWMAYYNENLLATAIFGPLGIFFLAFAAVAGTAAGAEGMYFFVFIGIVILIDAIVAFFQPVKLLPILLLIAAVAFFVTAVWWEGGDATMKTLTGALWMIYSIVSWYMGMAILMLVLKGKPVLPLLIKA